jgi:cobaltochelatase CobN
LGLNTPPTRRRIVRNMVTSAEGKLVNVARRPGHLFVCALGCCCGDTVHGSAPVPTDLYHEEWERRRLRPHVHLTISGCLGPCPLANVAMLLYEGRSLWFHSLNSERQVLALYDYIESLVSAHAYLPPPAGLAELQFTSFDWEGHGEGFSEAAQPTAAEGDGGFVVLTHADTDLLALARVVATLPPDFPPVRGYQIGHVQSEEDARAFVDAVVPGADVVILRLLGGTASFRGGFERVLERTEQDQQWLICLPGTGSLDPELTAVSNVGTPVAHEALAYLELGGLKNVEHLLRFLSDHLLTTGFGYDAPEPQPRHSVYYESPPPTSNGIPSPTIGVLFYRSHLLAGNTAFVDAIIASIEARGARALAVATASLQDYEATPETADRDAADLPTALRCFVRSGATGIDALITTTSFAATPGAEGAASIGAPAAWDGRDPFARLGVPVIQAMTSTSRREPWATSLRGLGPIDTAMNVAIPELDGRIIGVPVSFKEPVSGPSSLPQGEGDNGSPGGPQLAAMAYAPEPDRVDRTVGLALRLAALRATPNAKKRVAFLLTDYNAKASRVGAAVGLDTPASLLRVLAALRDAGYPVGDLPDDSDALLQQLIDRGTYDREVLTAAQLSSAVGRVPADRYQSWLEALPTGRRDGITSQWGPPPGRYYVDGTGALGLAGLEFGNTFVAIQPPRGYGMDPAAIYHTPDLPPPHPYFALYRWLGESQEHGGWGADAIVHVGKHGTLEWLPGKAVGLASDCFPDLLLGDLPLIYPFIVNDPGEGAQAKRRTHAVIIDHLTPPMTTAEGYGEIEELARLVDEYYQLEQLDPSKLPLLQSQIWDLIVRARLDADLGQLLNRDAATHTHAWDPQFHPDGVPYTISDMGARDFAHLLENINGYLCELTSAQIRDGLHVLGQAPTGAQLIDTLQSLVRVPNLDVPSLRGGIAAWYGLELEAVLDNLGARVDLMSGSLALGGVVALADRVRRPVATNADVLEAIDELGRRVLEGLAEADFATHLIPRIVDEVLSAQRVSPGGEAAAGLTRTLAFVCSELVPRLQRTGEEITNLLGALDGRHVPAGPSGAPTRGMAQVLPTGRNFYSVDPRGLPTAAAWTVGQRLADELIARYLTDEGRYPDSVGISIWGTSLMRTHGDDVAEVMALIGVRPRWQAESRRVVGYDVIPLSELGRPRVDVVCRISGFFRDAFPDLIALLDEAFRTVAALDEPLESNAIRRTMLAAQARLEGAGVAPIAAAERAGYRIFGSPPGAYGAGILPLIDERNWQTDADLAEVYVNWGGYAYGAAGYGADARPEFRTALAGVQAAVKNQDNREHDIFDSDDYFQYHGGMIAAIRSITGGNPRRYFGDSADPQRPRVRSLQEEALRVYRSRVVNPKWIASMQRHGYKGALELAATVDYLFGYDATSGVVDDWMYERLADAYALDAELQAFFRQSNPWALRDLTARLLEAMDRGLWANPAPEMRQRLSNVYLQADADVEARLGAPGPGSAGRVASRPNWVGDDSPDRPQ